MTNHRGEQIIFLISLPRSGSTLLQHILGGHPEVHTVPEPWLMLHLVYGLRPDGIDAEYNAAGSYRALKAFLDSVPGGESNYHEAVGRAAAHLYGKALEASGKKYFLDKTPRYYLIIPELQRIFPKSKFIFLLRHPLAVLSSIMDVNLKGNWIQLFGEYRRNDILKAPELILSGIRDLGPDAAVVRYETLVTKPETTVKHLCDRLGLAFDPGMIHYGNRVRFKDSPFVDPKSIYRHGNPVTDYLDTWPQKLDTPEKKEIAKIYLEFLGKKKLEDLGYSYEDSMEKLKSKKTASRQEAAIRRLFEQPAHQLHWRERYGLYVASSIQSRGVLGTLRRGVQYILKG